MDLTPPLTRSPVSPPNSYCSSERSSLDYPSPQLIAQHYKLASIYGGSPPCSMPTQMDPESSLPSLEAQGHPEWNHPGVLGVSTTTSHAMPSILSAEYDTFGTFSPATLSTQYHHPHEVFHASHHGQEGAISATPPPLASQQQRSPMPSSSRSALAYAPGVPLTHAASARLKLEGAHASEFGQGAEVTHYPSPRPVHTPGPNSDTMAYASATASSASYLAETAHHPQQQIAPPQQQQQSQQQQTQPAFFPGQANQGSALVQDRAFRVTRPRRAPRRLTTKEEANFQCEVKGCGKLFSRSYNFKAHMETHDENREYPFPCLINECSKKFVRKTDLQRHHQSVHMKERSHRCDFCSRMFARKDTLRRHMDDGCSKRFDIGTLDLRTESYDGLGAVGTSRSSGSASHLIPSTSALPPLALPPSLPGAGLIGTPRARDMMGSSDLSQQHHGWGR